MRRLITVLLLCGMPLTAAGAATQTIRINAYVPVICHAEFPAQIIPKGSVVPLGTISEFCNAGSGYQIIAHYTQTSDPGELLVDGVPVPLNGSGESVIVRMNGPRAITQTLNYVPGSTPIDTLSIELVAPAI